MKPIAIPALALLSVAFGLQDHGRGRVDVDDPAAVAQAFRTRCGACHAVPDPGFATDRAWLGQLPTTA